jgi:hypothetical protein
MADVKHTPGPHEGAFSAAAFNSADFVPVNGLGGSSGFVTL